jgi:glucose-1-phosphate thymidylyltransferase
MKGLIAAGGKGTRLRPITTNRNKHTIPLANQSMIELAVNKLAKAGITDIGVIINLNDTELEPILGDGSKYGVNISYIEQIGGALGVAHVIKVARDFLGEDDFVFYLGDNIILGEVKDFIDAFYNQKLNALLALSKVNDPERFGVPRIENNRIIEVLEKPDNPPSQYAVAGIYVYDKNIHNIIENLSPSARGEYEISDAHTDLIKKGFAVGYSEITGWWKDTGKPQDLLEGNQLLLAQIKNTDIKGEIDKNVTIEGNIIIEKGAQIKGKSFLRGPIIIGENCIIENSYIGPYTSIGDSCKIENTEIEHSLLMHHITIHSSKRIVDSIIGNGAIITDKENTFPKGHKLVIGDNSQVEL